MWAELVADVSLIPSGIYEPSNCSWMRLTQWLLTRRDDLPLHVLPDVVELFRSLSTSMFFADPLTPRMAETLASWLEEIEDTLERNPLTDQPRFIAAFRYHDLYRLAENVRHAFVLMAARVPAQARSYLQGVLKRQKSDEVVRDIKRLRGSLAQAAPAELVEIMITGLVPKAEADDHYRDRSIRREIFTHLDSDFLPSSPAQGPFLELLNSAAEHGLALIRRLVDHAVGSVW